MKQDILKSYPRLIVAIRNACPELTEKHTFDNGKCTKCGVTAFWDDRKPVNQITGEVAYGHDPLKSDGVMIEVTRHDERESNCYMGSQPVYLEHVLRTIGKKHKDHAYLREPSIVTNKSFYFSLTDIPDVKIEWNLLKPLSNQSKETLDWLESIICND